MAPWLVCSFPKRAVSSPGWGHCVVFLGKTLYSHSGSLPGVIVGENLTNYGGVSCDGLASCPPGGVEILLVPSCYRNPPPSPPHHSLKSFLAPVLALYA